MLVKIKEINKMKKIILSSVVLLLLFFVKANAQEEIEVSSFPYFNEVMRSTVPQRISLTTTTITADTDCFSIGEGTRTIIGNNKVLDGDNHIGFRLERPNSYLHIRDLEIQKFTGDKLRGVIYSSASTIVLSGTVTFRNNGIKDDQDFANNVTQHNRLNTPERYSFTDEGEPIFSEGFPGGGAINVFRSSVKATSATVNFIENNARYWQGGAILACDSIIHFNGSIVNFIKNECFSKISNGIHAVGSSIVFDQCEVEFEKNGIFTRSRSQVHFISSTLKFIDSSFFLVANVTFKCSNSTISFETGEGIGLKAASPAIFEKSILSFKNLSPLGALRVYNGSSITSKGCMAVSAQGSSIVFASCTIDFENNKGAMLAEALYSTTGAIMSRSTITVNNGNVRFYRNSGKAVLYARNSVIDFNNSSLEFLENECNAAVYVRGNGAVTFSSCSAISFEGNETVGVDDGVICVEGNGTVIFSSCSAINFKGKSREDADGGEDAAADGREDYDAADGGEDYDDDDWLEDLAEDANRRKEASRAVCVGGNGAVTFSNSEISFEDNKTEECGGAIRAAENARITFSSSIITFVNNAAKRMGAGGAICVRSSAVVTL
jgi:predicted outer membrane repeat protein